MASPDVVTDGLAVSFSEFGKSTESNLLSSSDTGTTSPGDFIVGAADGIDGPMNNVWNQKKLLLPQLVEKANPSDASFSRRLALTFRGIHFSDDAVLGTIVTDLRK